MLAQLGMRHRHSQGVGQVGPQGLSCCRHYRGVLGSQSSAISISNNPPAETHGREAQPGGEEGGGGGEKTKGWHGRCGGGVRVRPVAGPPKVGAGKNNMNSGEGHELNGSMDTPEEEGCRRLCSIEIPAYYTRSHHAAILSDASAPSRVYLTPESRDNICCSGHLQRGLQEEQLEILPRYALVLCGMCAAETLPLALTASPRRSSHTRLASP